MVDAFETLILLARPAAGKSEVLDFLRHLSDAERLSRFHVGRMLELDDYPMLWAWLEEDAILAQMGLERLHTDAGGSFLRREYWDVLVRRLCLEYRKALAERPELHADTTVLMEFSRGSEHRGYRSALAQIPGEILGRAAILYIDVSWEESLRKNRKRFNPARPHSVLEHALPDDKLERLYREVDWRELAPADAGHLSISGVRVPYVVMPNDDDVTSARGAALASRLEGALGRLWRL